MCRGTQTLDELAMLHVAIRAGRTSPVSELLLKDSNVLPLHRGRQISTGVLKASQLSPQGGCAAVPWEADEFSGVSIVSATHQRHIDWPRDTTHWETRRTMGWSVKGEFLAVVAEVPWTSRLRLQMYDASTQCWLAKRFIEPPAGCGKLRISISEPVRFAADGKTAAALIGADAGAVLVFGVPHTSKRAAAVTLVRHQHFGRFVWLPAGRSLLGLGAELGRLDLTPRLALGRCLKAPLASAGARIYTDMALAPSGCKVWVVHVTPARTRACFTLLLHETADLSGRGCWEHAISGRCPLPSLHCSAHRVAVVIVGEASWLFSVEGYRVEFVAHLSAGCCPLSVSLDGLFLAAVTPAQPGVQVWDVRSGQTVWHVLEGAHIWTVAWAGQDKLHVCHLTGGQTSAWEFTFRVLRFA